MSIQNIGIGLVANDGLGDSIRDAFRKTNENFTYLDNLTQNLVTGSLTASGNITLDATVASYWTGTIFLNGSRVATTDSRFEGGRVPGVTYFDSATPSTSTTTGAVILTAGGLAVAAPSNFGDLAAGNVTVTYNLSGAAVTSGTGVFTSEVSTGPLTINGASTATGNIIVGNVSAATTNATQRNVAAYYGYFQSLNGTLQTASQPNITQVGTLISLGITGNVSSANVVTGNIKASANITANNASITTNLKAGWGEVSGNLYSRHVNAGVGTFANATVQDVPSNYHVTNKNYVNSTIIGFAIGLGS